MSEKKVSEKRCPRKGGEKRCPRKGGEKRCPRKGGEKRWREEVSEKRWREEVSEKRWREKVSEKRWREKVAREKVETQTEKVVGKGFKRLQLHLLRFQSPSIFTVLCKNSRRPPMPNRARSWHLGSHLGSAETTPPAPLSGSQLCGRPPCSLCSRPFRLNRTSNDDGAEACCAAKP